MAKKQKNNQTKANRKLLLLLGILTLTVLASTFIGYKFTQRLDEVSGIAGTVSVRELILSAAEGTKKDAAVDPKTGDLYFPPSRLYVPYDPALASLTYNFYLGGPDGDELSISTRGLFGQSSVPLNSATDVDQLFAAVPKLQACQRGIRLLYKQSDNGDPSVVLKETIPLNNGKTLYAYTETACPELEEILTLLKNIKAY